MRGSIIYILVLFSLGSSAQEFQRPLKVWSSFGVSANVAEPVSVGFSRMYGFNAVDGELKYYQDIYSVRYKGCKNFTVSAGFMRSNIIRREKSNKIKHRFFGAINYRSKIGQLRVSNGLRLEKHGPVEKKYDYRLIYSFYVRPKSGLLIPAVKFTPFLSAQLFYNVGGAPVRQYDETGVELGKFEPNGLHRLRVRAGFYIKPLKKMKLTFYGMIQDEFNTVWAEKNNSRINVENPESGKVYRPFSNYFVLGMSVKYYLRKLDFSGNKKQSK